MSFAHVLRQIQRMDIEEKILNAGALLALIGVFFPWFGGEWFNEVQIWSGFGFYTKFIGLLIFLGQFFVLSIILLPMMGYTVVRPALRDPIRLAVGLQTVVLMVVAYSIFTNITFDFALVEIRFGVHVTLIGGIVESLYSFLRIHQQRKRSVQEFFRQNSGEPSPGAIETLQREQEVAGNDANLFTSNMR